MRKLTLSLNAVVVLFFACFLAYTFFAKTHVEHLGRDFVTQKTIAYAGPTVEFAEESLDSPLVEKVLSGDQILALRAEIATFRDDPSVYIAKLTGQETPDAIPLNANPFLSKISSLKSGIRSFYDDTLQSLIVDLRIFSVSNLLAGLLAFTLTLRSPASIRKSIVWFSLLMFGAVLYCSFIYVDGLSFFRILFRTHMGWWYPVLLCFVVASLYWDFGRRPGMLDTEVSSEENTA